MCCVNNLHLHLLIGLFKTLVHLHWVVGLMACKKLAATKISVGHSLSLSNLWWVQNRLIKQKNSRNSDHKFQNSNGSHIGTHTYARLTAMFPRLPRWASTRKVKPIWILLKQETWSGIGVSWVICQSAPRSRQITTQAPHHSIFYRPDALPVTQPTASKHWRHSSHIGTSTSKSERCLNDAVLALWFTQISANLPSPSLRLLAGQRADCKHEPVAVVVTQHHLMDEASKMRPSVSAADRFKYQAMYVCDRWRCCQSNLV